LRSPAWIDWDVKAPCASITDSVTVLRKNVIKTKSCITMQRYNFKKRES